MRPHLRFIGDVHGYISYYIHLAENAEYSVQLGDMGFDYKQISKKLSADKHKILAGNHDNYEFFENCFVNQTPHFLGDFGSYSVPQVGDIFFVRGGHSIDKNFRTWGVDWWSDEQLNYGQGEAALDLYKSLKPSIVISHECPSSVIPMVSTLDKWEGREIQPSYTAQLLENMLYAHQPKHWFFGHHHRSWSKVIGDTCFRCLDQLEVYDFPISDKKEYA